MTGGFEERLKIFRFALETLAGGPMNWTPLTRLMLELSTPWKAQSALGWLVGKGYVERPSRGVYRITDRGRALLRALKDA